MSHVGIWVCDGCGVEDRGGMAGFPPEDWVRVKATEKNRVESRTHDFCPECGVSVNVFEVAGSGTLIVQPKPKSKGRVDRVQKEEDLDDDDPGE